MPHPTSQQPDTASTATPALGFELGQRHLRAALVAPDGQLLRVRQMEYPFPATPDGDHAANAQALFAALQQTGSELRAEHGTPLTLGAIGVALPGLVQQHTQRLMQLPLLLALQGEDLRASLQQAFHAPVRLVNNAQAAAYAEFQHGAGRGFQDLLYLHIGANVSAGLVLGGKLQYGNSGLAGALGGMTIDPEQTGDHVTLEYLVTTENIVRRTKARLKRDSTSSLSRLGLPNSEGMRDFSYEDIVSAAENEDDLARLMLQRTGKFIGLAVCEIISLLNLSLLIVGGDPQAHPYLVPAISEEAERHTAPQLFNECRIVAAQLGAEASARGAALIAIEQAQHAV